jgi:ATP-dependent RNA helicase DeaD
VLVPTRELALQVTHEAKLLGEGLGVRSLAVYGGTSYTQQNNELKQGAHIVIGTPGRILDHLLRRTFTLDHLRLLIFDEADRMLSMGFYPDMLRVQSYLPRQHVASYMFSATFPTAVLRLAGQFLHEATFLNLSSDHVHVTEIAHQYYIVPGLDKDRSLVRIIEVENPLSALIFCNTKVRVEYVSVVLQRFGYDAGALSSDLAQGAREEILARVRKGELRFLVATDVAARGIDLPELTHVFQYEPPEDPEAFIHRSGRTGRAGGSGTAITLVSPAEKAALLGIGKRFGIDLQEIPLPSDEDVQRVVSERVTALLEARLRGRDRLKVERMQRFQSLATSLAQGEDETSLLAMLLDDFYQESFHFPLGLPAGLKASGKPSEKSSGKPTGKPGGASQDKHRHRQPRRKKNDRPRGNR